MKTSGSREYLRGDCNGSQEIKPAGVSHAGHGAFPPTGRVLRVQRRFVDTGKRVTEGGGKRLGVLDETTSMEGGRSCSRLRRL